ncbi:MAG: hypothetical protein WB439_13235 [Acidobacteriaceae bacterium]
MKKLLSVCIVSFSFLTVSAMAQTFRGVVSDSMCAHNNLAKASTAAHEACAQKCIKMGSPAVLIVGTTIYNVSNSSKLNAFAGKTVTVDGKLAGNTITVMSVKD